MTQHGFYSIVQKEMGVWHVRARVRHDLTNLVRIAELGKRYEIQRWPDADYRYRIIVTSEEDIFKIMWAFASSIDYPNFKHRIGDLADQRDRISTYAEIWGLMRRHQK